MLGFIWNCKMEKAGVTVVVNRAHDFLFMESFPLISVLEFFFPNLSPVCFEEWGCHVCVVDWERCAILVCGYFMLPPIY